METFAVFAWYCFPIPWFHFKQWTSIHNFSFITCCVLLCESGMPEHGATKSRNKRTRKEWWVLLATKFNLLQTSLETSPSCDGQVNGRRAHGWSLLYGSFWLVQQSICKHEELPQLWNKPFACWPNTDPWFDNSGGAANMALSQNTLRQDRSWWIAFVILAMQSKDASYILFRTAMGHLSLWRYFFAAM